MAAHSPAKQLQDELSCSLCHKYFTGPVSIHCGHNFCQVCITQFWEEQETDFCCPRCGEKSLSREMRPRKELEVIVAIAKQMNFEMVQSVSGEKLCEMHQKPLKFFCKGEQKLMCHSCYSSEDHTSHTLVSVEDAAEYYKQKLQIRVQALKEEREKALDVQRKEEDRNKEFLEKLEGEKQKIVSKFEELEIFLKEQKKSMLDQLDELVNKQEEFTTWLSSEIYFFDTLIHEVEEECKQPASVLLQDVGETFSRCRTRKFQQPQDVRSELEEKLGAISKNHLIMQETVREFREGPGRDLDSEQQNEDSKEVLPLVQQKAEKNGRGDQTFPCENEVKWVKVNLDPDTAHPNLNVSADQTILREVDSREQWSMTDYPEQFTKTSCVLACEGFTLGRHYWEVEVGKEAFWAVGVATKSVKRKEIFNLNPEEGIWVLRKQYHRLAANGLTLNSDIPRRVGVFLDCRSNRVLFFDADQGRALYTFHSASLQNKKIHPFFWLEESSWSCRNRKECYINVRA